MRDRIYITLAAAFAIVGVLVFAPISGASRASQLERDATLADRTMDRTAENLPAYHERTRPCYRTRVAHPSRPTNGERVRATVCRYSVAYRDTNGERVECPVARVVVYDGFKRGEYHPGRCR